MNAVTLVPPNPDWPRQAQEQAERLGQLLGPNLVRVHHIGSTSIAGIWAKPILDLLPEVASLKELDLLQAKLEGEGYQWLGEFGLPDRRLLLVHQGPKRVANIHCYPLGHGEVLRHLAFRDYLRAHPELAQEYEKVKRACSQLHQEVMAYNQCKDAWIKRTEAEAMRSSGNL